MQHVWVRRETCTGFQWGRPKERGNWQDLSIERKTILQWILQK